MMNEQILAMQAPSTRAALSQCDEERIAHRLSPILKEAQRIKEDGTVDLNIRAITQQEAEAYSSLRCARGEWIAESRKEEVKTLTEGKKNKAVNAFMTLRTLEMVKDKFKELMGQIFKPQHAEIVAEEMRKRNSEA